MKNKTKKCTKCGKTYPATKEYFNRQSENKDRLNTECKKCYNEKSRNYYTKNSDKILKTNKNYRDNNRGKVREISRNYRKNNVVEIKEYSKEYRAKNLDKLNAKSREYYHKSEKRREYYKKYRIKNRDRMKKVAKIYSAKNREIINDRSRERTKTDIQYRLGRNLRSRVRTALILGGARKSRHTMELVGCSIKDLINHIESQFDNKMTWKNYGKYGWHIDHIKPCVAFDLTKPEEQNKCFNYKNLQPMWGTDNRKKNSFYNGKYIRKRREICPR
jgi:hypothetical protein